jgi:hypothetical protein
MLRLIYISTSRHVTTRPQLGQILRVSRDNNASVGVTGLLVAGGKRFLQALEGPVPAVEATFARIQKDDRHLGCVILGRQHVEERAFGSWAMGCQLSAAGEGGSIAADVGFLIERIRDPRVRSEFEQFALQQAA